MRLVRLLKTACHLSTRQLSIQHCPESVVIQFSERGGQETRWKRLESRFGGEGRLEDGFDDFVREGTFGATGIIRGHREEIGGTDFKICHGVTGGIHGQRGNRRTIPP